MENIKKQNVRYEFFNYGASGTILAQTLVLNNPASIKFVLLGSSGFCTINNVYQLQGSGIVFQGGATAQYPYELNLNNNIGESDVTNYKIVLDGIIFGDANLVVICKYYVK